MLKFVTGNLFESQAQTLINTVNCVGIMGKGIALAFRQCYPEMYEEYRIQCEQGEIRPGIVTLHTRTRPWILNFPTKRHWKNRSRLGDIELGLQAVAANYETLGIKSLGVPALGCGHGGLYWPDVRALIEKYLSKLDIDVEVYEPGSVAEPSPELSPDGESPRQLELWADSIDVGKKKRRRKKRAS